LFIVATGKNLLPPPTRPYDFSDVQPEARKFLKPKLFALTLISCAPAIVCKQFLLPQKRNP